MFETNQEWVPRAETVIKVGILVCLLNVVLTGILAGTETLKTAERGDITYLDAEETPGGPIEAVGDRRFVIERPTDVDAFYDTVVRVRSGGPLFNPWGGAETIQRYHYHPFAYFFFLPLYLVGYVGFKFGWLLVSMFATALGTYLLVNAEIDHGTIDLSGRATIVLAVASIGFAPMVSNFKTGQTTPIMYVFIAAAWWGTRAGRDRNLFGGGALVGPAIFKPYFVAPLVIFWTRDRWRGVAGFVAVLALVNVVSALYFGVDTVMTYYDILIAFVVETEGSSNVSTSLSKWWSNSLRMFFWLGPFGLLVRALLIVPFAYLTAVHVLEDAYESEVFALSIVSVMFIVSSTSVIDLAMVLAAVIVLGARLHDSHPRAFALVALSFLLMHVHPYFMEATVGYGATLVPIIRNNADLVLTIVPPLQPAMYGLVLLWGLTLYSVYDRNEGVPRPMSLTW
ncbi:MAG: glycosyltransferase family 87 protein [Halobacteriales archaeon]